MIVIPRLDRESAKELLELRLQGDIEEITAHMPDISVPVTYAPVGGGRIEQRALEELREAVVALAKEHGMPDSPVRVSEFEGNCARILHRLLPMTAYEASHEEVWSYLTCCWLLDVAVWRFGVEADERRYVGNVNRNTFRRMWWRAEVLGREVDLRRLGEDELVNIMERPTVAADRRMARSIASEFLHRVDSGDAPERMQLMREAMKRILRLTPIVAFSALDDSAVRTTVREVFDAADAGIRGRPIPLVITAYGETPAPSPEVVKVDQLDGIGTAAEARRAGSNEEAFLETIGQVAIDISRRTGRVTNITLREVVSIGSAEAREVLSELVSRGVLARRGVRRGTYYVIAEAETSSGGDLATAPIARGDQTSPRPSETALGRLLRRKR